MIFGIKEGAKRFPHPHRCPFFLSLRHPAKKGSKKLKPKPTHPRAPPKKNKTTQHNTTQGERFRPQNDPKKTRNKRAKLRGEMRRERSQRKCAARMQ
jgi:hypothetical protein